MSVDFQFFDSFSTGIFTTTEPPGRRLLAPGISVIAAEFGNASTQVFTSLTVFSIPVETWMLYLLSVLPNPPPPLRSSSAESVK